MEKSFLGHSCAVSQFHKEMHSGIPTQWFYLHVPHAMVHDLQIHMFDPSA